MTIGIDFVSICNFKRRQTSNQLCAVASNPKQSDLVEFPGYEEQRPLHCRLQLLENLVPLRFSSKPLCGPVYLVKAKQRVGTQKPLLTMVILKL